MLRVVLFLCMAVTASVLGQLMKPGRCPVVKSQEKIDFKQYMAGTWYMVSQFPYMFDQPKCTRSNATIEEDGHFTFRVSEVTHGIHSVTDKDAYIPDDSEPGHMKIKASRFLPYMDYQVVHTDYKTYNMYATCVQVPGFHLQFAWIMSRTKTLPETTLVGLKSELAAFGIDTSFFAVEDQNLPICN